MLLLQAHEDLVAEDGRQSDEDQLYQALQWGGGTRARSLFAGADTTCEAGVIFGVRVGAHGGWAVWLGWAGRVVPSLEPPCWACPEACLTMKGKTLATEVASLQMSVPQALQLLHAATLLSAVEVQLLNVAHGQPVQPLKDSCVRSQLRCRAWADDVSQQAELLHGGCRRGEIPHRSIMSR
jgi:hypothetical protein